MYAEHQGLVNQVNSAKTDLDDAKAALATAEKGSDTTSLQNKLNSAQKKYDAANLDVTNAQSKVDSISSQITDYQNQLDQLG